MPKWQLHLGQHLDDGIRSPSQRKRILRSCGLQAQPEQTGNRIRAIRRSPAMRLPQSAAHGLPHPAGMYWSYMACQTSFGLPLGTRIQATDHALEFSEFLYQAPWSDRLWPGLVASSSARVSSRAAPCTGHDWQPSRSTMSQHARGFRGVAAQILMEGQLLERCHAVHQVRAADPPAKRKRASLKRARSTRSLPCRITAALCSFNSVFTTARKYGNSCPWASSTAKYFWWSRITVTSTSSGSSRNSSPKLPSSTPGHSVRCVTWSTSGSSSRHRALATVRVTRSSSLRMRCRRSSTSASTYSPRICCR